jgi:hypothetical protein
MSDLADLAEGLPREMTGRPGVGISWEKVADIVRYNRVEGTTVSLGARVPAPISFTTLYGTGRFGFADQRVMVRIAAVRDAPGGRRIIAASRDLVDIDPFAHGLTFGNSLRGIFTGHDDGAYLLAQGGRITYETSHGPGTELTWSARAEQEQSVNSEARAFFPRIAGSDGYFPATAPVRRGFAVGGGLRVEHSGFATRWLIDAEALSVAGERGGRLAAEFRLQRLAGAWATARIKGGVAFGATAVPQLALNAGGLATVRGYDFGVTQGDALWAVQLDLAKPTRRDVKLAAFVDAGQAGNRRDFGTAPFLSGAGVAVSVLGGFVRAELSHPITQTFGRGLRFDLVFGGVR